MRTTAILLAYAAALAFGTYHTFRPTFDSGFVRVQTDTGDGMLNHLILENSWLALTDPDYRGTLLTPPFYHPEPYTLLYSENLFGAAPIYWALRCVTNHEFAYIWWQIACSALNFVAFAVVARWLKFPHPLAAVGAFLWAFAAVHAEQIRHSQMIPRFFMPLGAYYAIRLVYEPSAKALNRTLGAVFLQCLACVYTGWFFAVGLIVFLPALAVLRPGGARELGRYFVGHKRQVGFVLVAWALAMAALFVPYIVVNWDAVRGYEHCYGFFPTVSAWFTGPEGGRWCETLAPVRDPNSFECLLFCGFALYGLMLAAAVHLLFWRHGARPALWPVATAGLITAAAWVVFTLATSQEGESLWRVVRFLPGGGAIRVVSRVYVTVYLFGTIGALAWLAMVLERAQRPRTRAAILVPLLAALVWEQTGFEQKSFDRRDFYPLVEASAGTLRGADAGYVVPRYVDSRGHTNDGPYGEVFAMWAGMRANVPVVNGYSGRGPHRFPAAPVLSDDDIRAWLTGKFRGTVRIIDSETPGTYRTVVIE